MITIAGKTVTLRLVEPDDARFIHDLRTNPQYNQYLSKVDGTVQDQRRWIEDYKQREKAGIEYYYIIVLNAGAEPIGTVRLYDFIGERDSFSWGSWVLKTDKRGQLAAIESAMLVYELGFCVMGFKASHFEVMKGNSSVMRFHSLFGATMTHEDEAKCFFSVTPARLKRARVAPPTITTAQEAT